MDTKLSFRYDREGRDRESRGSLLHDRAASERGARDSCGGRPPAHVGSGRTLPKL